MRRLNFYLDEEIYNKLKALACENETSIAEIARRILSEGLSIEHANKGVDALTQTIRRVIRDELKPVENRMAKLSAKAAVASASSMYLNVQAIADMGKNDAVEIYDKARKKAVAYVRMPADEME
ncbi:MAG: ribbon-helix-helix protein, CopG family [Caloramator sp.]|nr:ribbon-helix-helix protein, CopG family [Caloramator sp.]